MLMPVFLHLSSQQTVAERVPLFITVIHYVLGTRASQDGHGHGPVELTEHRGGGQQPQSHRTECATPVINRKKQSTQESWETDH